MAIQNGETQRLNFLNLFVRQHDMIAAARQVLAQQREELSQLVSVLRGSSPNALPSQKQNSGAETELYERQRQLERDRQALLQEREEVRARQD
jgi:hypothetical protein